MIYALRYDIPDSPIKIGYTEDRRRLGGRLRHYETHSPWEVEGIFAVEGGRALETSLLSIFKRYRIRGEWFRPEPPLLAFCIWVSRNPKASRGAIVDMAIAVMRYTEKPEQALQSVSEPAPKKGALAKSVRGGVGKGRRNA